MFPELSCHVACRCINCANPYGKKNAELTIKTERKRKRHHNIPNSSSEFTQTKGEPHAPSKWTDYEHFILQQIVDIIVDDSDPDYARVHELFLKVVG